MSRHKVRWRIQETGSYEGASSINTRLNLIHNHAKPKLISELQNSGKQILWYRPDSSDALNKFQKHNTCLLFSDNGLKLIHSIVHRWVKDGGMLVQGLDTDFVAFRRCTSEGQHGLACESSLQNDDSWSTLLNGQCQSESLFDG
jgi:hypothetical protein